MDTHSLSSIKSFHLIKFTLFELKQLPHHLNTWEQELLIMKNIRLLVATTIPILLLLTIGGMIIKVINTHRGLLKELVINKGRLYKLKLIQQIGLLIGQWMGKEGLHIPTKCQEMNLKYLCHMCKYNILIQKFSGSADDNYKHNITNLYQYKQQAIFSIQHNEIKICKPI